MKFSHCQECRYQVMWYAIAINAYLVIIKGGLAVISGSAALMADAFHSSADVIASIVTIFSLKLAKKPADNAHGYGYGKIQFVSSAIVGMILVGGAIYLLLGSLKSLFAGDYQAPGSIALFGAFISAILNELLYRYQMCVYAELNSPAILANAWDNRSDALSSVAVLVGLAFAVFGFPIIDPLAAIGVSLVVVKIGLELVVESVKGLMDAAPEGEELKDIYKVVREMPGVLGISYLRARTVGEALHVEINVQVSSQLKVYEGDLIVEMLKEKILRTVENIHEVQIFLTPEDTDSPPLPEKQGDANRWTMKAQAFFDRLIAKPKRRAKSSTKEKVSQEIA